MSDSPSELELLYFARRVVVQQATSALAQLDGWIAAAEQREAGRRRAQEARPAPPDWLLQSNSGGSRAAFVHTGDCRKAAGERWRPVTEQQAREALREQVPPCPLCRPETALGILD
ncbi:DUF6233 domain-containing protein [Streptomyces bauhiniae]